MVGALGHDVPGLFVLVFAVGSALAGLAGVIGGFMWLTQPRWRTSWGPIVFVVVVVGGLGSLAGALIRIDVHRRSADFRRGRSTIRCSISSACSGSPSTARRRSTSSMRSRWRRRPPIVPYLLLVLMLIVRPRGLLGTRDA
jgi:branched-chain amino acid transport system permease protein